MTTWLGGDADRPTRFFSGPEAFRDWLDEHHATETELWVGLFKKHAAHRGLTWDQAVPEALCYGWIDSVSYRLDEDATRQRWTPRKAVSNWSNVNVALVEGLIAAGRMRPAGLAAYARRRPETTGIYTYERDGELALPADYEARVRAVPEAEHFFFVRATPSYRRTVIGWVMAAKQEATREKRLAELIADSAAGLLVKNQRYGELPKWAQPPG